MLTTLEDRDLGWKLPTAGEVIATSEGYSSKAACVCENESTKKKRP